MNATVFLAGTIVVATVSLVAALTHVAQASDAAVGAGAAEASNGGRATPLAARLADDAARARTTTTTRPVPGSHGEVVERARATSTTYLVRREQRLRAIGQRRHLSADEAVALAAARLALSERGRTLPPADGLPALVTEAQRP